MTDRTIHSDVQANHPSDDFSIDDAAAALVSRWKDADDKPSGERKEEEQPEVEKPETTDQEAEENDADEQEAEETDEDPEADDADNDDDEQEDEDAPATASDDTEVEVTVDGEVKKVSVKDLKRLYGQEASLTRKSQEVSAARKKADEDMARASTTLQKMVEKAQARWKPYQEIDMLLASKKMSDEDFAQLRADAKAAYDDVKFLTEELDDFMKTVQTEQIESFKQQAKEAVKALTTDGNPHHIPGWNDALYADIRKFAVQGGMDENIVNSIIDPAAIKMLWKAMQYDKVRSVSAEKQTKVKTKATAKKVLKSTKTSSVPATKAKAAIEKLRKSGSTDDAAEALLARWGD